eukprot:1326533-Amorphochlora_amoeboformis.AAC.1
MAASDAILELEGKEEKLVKRLLQDSFRYRCDGMSESKLDGISEALGVEKVRAKEKHIYIPFALEFPLNLSLALLVSRDLRSGMGRDN